jgi:hypothetical protein
MSISGGGSDEPSRPGSSEARKGYAEAQQVEGGGFRAYRIDETGQEEDVAPVVEVGPERGPMEPRVDATRPVDLNQGGAEVRFTTDVAPGTVGVSTTPDMSGANHDDIVLLSGNWFASLSTDGGSTFTTLDPTTIFPSAPTVDAAGNLLDNGFCCDQVIHYVPEFDRFIWFMQFCGSGANCLQGINKVRIAAARADQVRSSGGTAWTYWDITSAGVGIGTTTMDYPDVSVGSGSLWFSADAVGSGLLVVRIPLAEIAAGGTINYEFTNPADSATAYGGHISQNTGNEVYWLGHVSTSRVRAFSWREGDGSYFWRDIDINSWPNSDYSSKAPDGTDWLSFMAGFPGSAAIGATRRFDKERSEVWFAWTAARGGGFPHPYVEVLVLDTSSWTVVDQWPIWNPDIAFAYPSLTTNRDGEIGISLGWGGGGTAYANHAVGILGDFVVWFSELSDAALTRWGDYVTARQCSPAAEQFAGVGYAVLANAPPATGVRINTRYVVFGRP